MQRYFLKFSYDGTLYHGWQIQPHDTSVQQVMTEIMQQLFGKELSLTGAGRTDAGVHALRMTAHFDVPEPIADTEAMIAKLNSMMPADICILELSPVRAEAHARFDAISRTYEYRFSLQKNPFQTRYSTRLFSCPDVEAMNRASKLLFEYNDFTSFSKVHTDVKTNYCRIMKAYWEIKDEQLIFTVQADRFLRNMVRALVGTMLEIGRHKMNEDDFRNIIERKDRCAAGTSAPPQGLFLTDVAYPEDLFC